MIHVLKLRFFPLIKTCIFVLKDFKKQQHFCNCCYYVNTFLSHSWLIIKNHDQFLPLNNSTAIEQIAKWLAIYFLDIKNKTNIAKYNEKAGGFLFAEQAIK